MSKDKPIQAWYPIEKIGIFEQLTEGQLDSTEESYSSFLLCKDKPHVLDNVTVDRGITLMENQLEDADLMDNQIFKWKTDIHSEDYNKRVSILKDKNKRFRKLSERCLNLCKELKKGTINTILDMEDGELASKLLSGELIFPK
jgi:hypothetical protein